MSTWSSSPGFVSHLKLDWTERRHAHFLYRLGTFSRLIRFDKRGTGMSDRPGELPDLETRMGDVAAVMEAATLRASSAVRVLRGRPDGDPLRGQLPGAGPPAWSSTRATRGACGHRTTRGDSAPRSGPGTPCSSSRTGLGRPTCAACARTPTTELAGWWGERCRAATSPGAARALIEMASLIDVRDVLGAVQAPTLVLHRRDDIDVAHRGGSLPRRIAYRVRGSSSSKAPITSSASTRTRSSIRSRSSSVAWGRPRRPRRHFTTLLAVHLERPIDEAWLRGILRGVLDEHRGMPAVAEHAGVLATFDGPGRAVRCGLALVQQAPRPPACMRRSVCTPPRSPAGAQISRATASPSPWRSPIGPRPAKCG